MKKRLSFLPTSWLLALILLISAFHSVITTAATAPDVCIQNIGGVVGKAPILDGTVSGDAGWNNAVELNLSGDNGLTTASKLLIGRKDRYIKINTTGKLETIMQDSLYIGLVVNAPLPTAPTAKKDTTLVLGLSPDDSAYASDWRLHITPFQTGGAKATYWNNTADHTSWPNNHTVAKNEWPLANLQCDPQCPLSNTATTTNGHWELELVIPIGSTGVKLGTGSNPSYFKIYANVLNTLLGNAVNSVGQDVWPPNLVLPNGAITNTTPNTTDWGKVYLQTPTPNTCTGVKLAWENIGVLDPTATNYPNSSKIVNEIKRVKASKITETSIAACDVRAYNYQPSNLSSSDFVENIFIAKPENTMDHDATKLSATFRLADWGIPGVDPNAESGGGTPHFEAARGLMKPLGAPVALAVSVEPKFSCDPTVTDSAHNLPKQCEGVTNNPTDSLASYATITQGGVGELKAKWTLNYKQSCFYKFSSTPAYPNEGTSHQCMQVDLHSDDPNTRLLNRSVQKNMDFVDASTVKRLASISGDQGPLPTGKTSHRFLLQVDQEEQGSPYHTTRTTEGWFSGREVNEKGYGHFLNNQQDEQISQYGASAASVDHNVNPKSEKGYLYFRDKQLAKVASEHFGKDVNHMLSWIVRGFVYTGDKIIINGNAYENVRRVGDFGLVAGHAGSISGWTADFRTTPTSDSSQITQISPDSNVYTLEVTPGHQATIETTIVAEEVIDNSQLEWWQWLLLFLVILLLLLILFWRKPQLP